MKDEKLENRSFVIKTYTFVRSFFVVAGWTGISRIFGLVREMLFANIFGVNAFSDIYAVAVKLPNFFRKFFAEGALNAVFVPKFSTLLTTDSDKNIRIFANKIFSTLIVGLLFFVLFLEIIMPSIISIVAPGFRDNPEIFVNTIHFSRLMFPYILLISIVALMSGMLNSMHHFSAPAAISIVLNISLTTSLIIGKIFSNKISLTFIMHLLSASMIIGGIVQCVILWFKCKKNGLILVFAKSFFTPEIKKLFKATIPGMIGASVMQINVFIDLAFASLLPTGSVSYLNYSDRINQLPISLFGVAIGTTLLPSLAKHWAKGESEEAYLTQNKAILFGFLFVIPATIGLFVLAEPIVDLLYGHGKFTPYAVEQTMLALKAFIFGLPTYVLTKIFSTIFFANKDTRTPVIIAAISVFVNGVLNYILLGYFAHVGIAAATAISSFINASMCIIILQRRKQIYFSRELIRKSIMIFSFSIAMGFLVSFVYSQICIYEKCFFIDLAKVVIPTLIGTIFYSAVTYFFVFKKNKSKR